MSVGQQQSFPADAAKLMIWPQGLQNPTGFLVTRDHADQAMRTFRDRSGPVVFQSYPDGSGMRSDSVFPLEGIRALTIEYPTVKIVRALNA